MAGFSIILITMLMVVIPIFIFFIIAILIRLIADIIKLLSSCLFFSKCKEQFWKAIIPFYNDYTLIKLADLKWWWVIPIWIYRVSTVAICIIIWVATYYDNDEELIDLLCGLVILLSSVIYLIIGLIMLLCKANAYYNICKKTDLNPLISVLFTYPYSRYIMYFIVFFNKNITYNDNIHVSKNGILE